jgi:hypothetical protein
MGGSPGAGNRWIEMLTVVFLTPAGTAFSDSHIVTFS